MRSARHERGLKVSQRCAAVKWGQELRTREFRAIGEFKASHVTF